MWYSAHQSDVIDGENDPGKGVRGGLASLRFRLFSTLDSFLLANMLVHKIFLHASQSVA